MCIRVEVKVMNENINGLNSKTDRARAKEAAVEAVGPIAGNFTKAAVENFEEKLVRKTK